MVKERNGLTGIEINAVMHRDLACAGCSHASPVSPDWNADPLQVKRDLDDLARRPTYARRASSGMSRFCIQTLPGCSGKQQMRGRITMTARGPRRNGR
jgi:hypothetical protein